jgi:microtubule-associated protein-like 6
MGQNISADQAKMVADHLNKQEELIRHLQSVVTQQQRALDNLRVEPVLDASKEKDYDGNESGDEEFQKITTLATEREHRRERESKVTHEELKKPDVKVWEPTKDDEKNFMATKPWLGRLFAPTNYAKDAKWDEQPDIKLTLEHVYGYRSRLVRNNVFHIDGDTILYFAAAVGIVHNLANNTQKFFFGHDDDILCIDYHQTKKIAVTGQQGRTPAVIVWNVETMTEICRISGYHKRAIMSVAISLDATKVVSVGADDNFSVAVNDIATGQLLVESKGDSNRILDVQWNQTKASNSSTDFVTVGEKHIKFWSMASNQLKFQSGVLGAEGDRQTFLTCGFTPEYTIVGCKSGDLYLFKGNKIDPTMSFGAHNGMIYSVWVDTVGDNVFTGGKDGYVYVWGATDFKKKKGYDFNKLAKGTQKNSIRAINCRPGQTTFYAGSITSTIYKVDLKTNDPVQVVTSHFGDLNATDDNYGELWGLSTHPSKNMFATVAEDRTLRIWDVPSRKILQKFDIKEPGLCCTFSPDGKKIAIGLTDGNFLVYDVAGKAEELRKKVSKRRIVSIRYSPNGKYLAVGHAENAVQVFDVEQEYKKMGTCSGASSVILHLDWSQDSKYLQTNSQAYELLHYELNGTFVAKASDLKDTKWATQECVLGWDVQGIWPEESDGSDVNACNKSHGTGKQYLVTAEDSGLVKVFNYPCVGSHLNKEGVLTKRPMSYRAFGHSSHVTNVGFVADDTYVISTGGADLTVMQWKVEKA